MAASVYAEDLTCSVCLTLFSDPVTLLCGHSFCRKCVADCPSSQCPLCRAYFPSSDKGKYLPTNHILKSLAEKAKEAAHETNLSQTQDRPEAQWLCPDHDEKLKLFCVTDQELTCIICRDGEKHEGHKFKPVKEAAASLRKELENSIEKVFTDIFAIESLADKQREEITKTKERSSQLMSQMRKQFEEMHQFLRKREDEIKNELKNQEEGAVKEMTQRLNSMETALTQNRELEVNWRGALKMESEKFLQNWTKRNSMKTEHLFRPRADDLHVINTSLFLGPYETHLQFFMWKEMLQVIQPRAEPLFLRNDNKAYVSVSDDGRSLFCAPKSTQNQQIGFRQASSGFGIGTPPPSFGYNAPKRAQNKRGGLKKASGVSRFELFSDLSDCAPKSTRNQQGASRLTPSDFEFETSTRFSNFDELLGDIPSQDPFSSSFGQPAPSTGGAIPFGEATSHRDQPTNTCTAVYDATYNAFSTNEFTSGQCYWEVEVGQRDYWKLGIKDYFLKYERRKYVTSANTKLKFTNTPRKIGIYLNCSSKKLSFYDADKMTRIHTMSCSSMSVPVSAYFNIRCTDPDHNPLTVCWY